MVATSAEIAQELSEKGIPQQRIVVIDEGVDLTEFSPGKKPKYLLREFGITEDVPVVMNIGMLRPDKGQLHFLNSIKHVLGKVPHAKIFIVGGKVDDGSINQRLNEYVAEHDLQDSVVLTGYRNDVAELTRLADIVILSSLVEAQSRIIPQAFATKRPVIATNVGGIPELVIHNQTGVLVPPANSSALAKAIIKMLENPAFSHELACNGYEFAKQNLCFITMMNKIVAMYSSVLPNAKKTSLLHKSP